MTGGLGGPGPAPTLEMQTLLVKLLVDAAFLQGELSASGGDHRRMHNTILAVEKYRGELLAALRATPVPEHASPSESEIDLCVECKQLPDSPYSSRNPALTVCRNCWSLRGPGAGTAPPDRDLLLLEMSLARLTDELNRIPELRREDELQLAKPALEMVRAMRGWAGSPLAAQSLAMQNRLAKERAFGDRGAPPPLSRERFVELIRETADNLAADEGYDELAEQVWAAMRAIRAGGAPPPEPEGLSEKQLSALARKLAPRDPADMKSRVAFDTVVRAYCQTAPGHSHWRRALENWLTEFGGIGEAGAPQ